MSTYHIQCSEKKNQLKSQRRVSIGRPCVMIDFEVGLKRRTHNAIMITVIFFFPILCARDGVCSSGASFSSSFIGDLSSWLTVLLLTCGAPPIVAGVLVAIAAGEAWAGDPPGYNVDSVELLGCLTTSGVDFSFNSVIFYFGFSFSEAVRVQFSIVFFSSWSSPCSQKLPLPFEIKWKREKPRKLDVTSYLNKCTKNLIVLDPSNVGMKVGLQYSDFLSHGDN